MARLSWYELKGIKEKILEDLYGALEEKLMTRRIEIAKKNREYVMAPLQQFIDQIPENLFSVNTCYQVFIKYKPAINDHTKYALQEIWEYKQTKNVINPDPIFLGNLKHAKSNLDRRLQDSAAELCEEIIALNTEKGKMKNFLDTTTDTYSGSLQLKKVWPESLHKYFPPEPVKSSKKKTKTKIISPPEPDFLKNRLTTNLLEGN
jgi:hypothetical protein